MQRSDRWPGFFVRAEEPDGIGSQPGRLSRSGDLDGRIRGLRREENVVDGVFELGEEVLPGNAAPIESERTRRV